jgi:hypothetical protein
MGWRLHRTLAERERCTLVTADKRPLAAAKKSKGVEVRGS